jgi:hypothetical protein
MEKNAWRAASDLAERELTENLHHMALFPAK